MRPSRYIHKIDIQEKTSVTDEWGGQSFTWSDVATEVWCKVVPVRGREMVSASAEYSEATARIYTRYRDDIDASMRIVWRGIEHGIVGQPVDIDGRGIELEITVSAILNEDVT